MERAVQIDPNYCEEHSNLAISLLFGWIIWREPQIPGRAKALMHAQRAVEIDPGDSHARRILGCVQLYERNWDEAKFQFDTAVRQNPNNADAVAWMGELQIYLGKPQAALIACAEALRLNPRPPGWYFWIMGMAQISSGHYEEAVASLSREETYGTGSREHLIAALALAGRVSEAQEEARLFLAGNPNWRFGDLAANSPFRSMSIAQPFVDGWRLAGLPMNCLAIAKLSCRRDRRPNSAVSAALLVPREPLYGRVGFSQPGKRLLDFLRRAVRALDVPHDLLP
ncbi:tetratricopeptide repeat protein [Mesorhizobium sp.]|uniref:tetratricopeptide repeat protein n=1 Tax=Mesorhizobium sp. TaxID=1871066 RepID=UPI0025BF92F2|nr:tetratricopeptide repeat protein [Mesorhizobium sp.]